MRTRGASIFSVNFADHKAVAEAVNSIWNDRSSLKNNMERDWLTNIAWFKGHQNLIWSEERKALAEPDKVPWRVRMIVNRIQGSIRTRASKFWRGAPDWDVLPATGDAIDIQTAHLNNQILESSWYAMNMTVKSLDNIIWTVTTGNCFLHAKWDPDEGPFIGSIGEEDLEDLFEGDTKVEVVSPFEMIVDPLATRFEDATWCMRSMIVDRNALIEDYPKAKKANFVTPNGRSTLGILNNFKSRLGFQTTGVADQDQVIVHQLWVKPRRNSKKGLKKGKLVLVAGDMVIDSKDFPYDHGQLPFCHMREVIVPGQLWGDCTLTQLIPVQAEINRTQSQLIENRNLASRPKWTVSKLAGIANDAITTQPGQIIQHNHGAKPEPVIPPPIPSYVNQLLQTNTTDFEDISGIHEVSQAEAPGQIRSGAGVLALVEQDEQRDNITLEDFSEQLARLGSQILHLKAQFVSERRIARVVGTNDEILMLNYNGRELRGTGGGIPGANLFDVRVKVTRGLPNSRLGQQEVVGKLVQLGIFNPQDPQDKKTVLQMLAMGNVQNSMDKARVHRSRQLQEIEKIINGDMVLPEEFHDHATHLEILNEFRNSARYDTLDQQQRQRLEQHAQGHQQWISILAVKPQIMAREAATLLLSKQQGIGARNEGLRTQQLGQGAQSPANGQGPQNQSG